MSNTARPSITAGGVTPDPTATPRSIASPTATGAEREGWRGTRWVMLALALAVAGGSMIVLGAHGLLGKQRKR
jgi:hypothetical protein